jgi:hypothetical protein
MTTKLIPLKLLSDGNETVSFLNPGKRNASAMWLSRSIIRDGLLNPLVVTQQGGKFIVIDGKKRLNALRQMAKSKRLSKAMTKIPCIVQSTLTLSPVENRRPLLMSGPELAHKIILEAQGATSHMSIAQRFECDLSVVEDCLSLSALHPEILLHFNSGAVTLEQAAALATIENMKAQLDLLQQLGPFVSNTEIVAAIRSGATVVELSEDNIIFLPSRRSDAAQDAQRAFEFDKSSIPAGSRIGSLAA